MISQTIRKFCVWWLDRDSKKQGYNPADLFWHWPTF